MGRHVCQSTGLVFSKRSSLSGRSRKVDFRSVLGQTWPTTLDRRSSFYCAGCTTNQNRRPSLRPLRDDARVHAKVWHVSQGTSEHAEQQTAEVEEVNRVPAQHRTRTLATNKICVLLRSPQGGCRTPDPPTHSGAPAPGPPCYWGACRPPDPPSIVGLP